MARKKKTHGDPDQLQLNYSSAINERLARIRSLFKLEFDHGPKFIQNVIELLERVALCSDDHGRCRARVVAIAAGIVGRGKVSERTVRTWRQNAVSLGVLSADPRSHKYGRGETNVWQIDYGRIEQLVKAAVGRQLGGSRAAETSAPRAAETSAPRAAETSAPSICPLGSPLESGSGTGAETGTDHLKFAGGKSPGGSDPAPPHNVEAVGPGVVVEVSAAGNGKSADPREHDAVRSELVAKRLRDSSSCPVASLPPGSLAGNCFAPLESKHLGDTRWMVAWFRSQLGVPSPLFYATQADLLIALAAAIYADEIPASEVRKSRVALFAFLVSRRLWRRVVANLNAANRRLVRLLESYPEALRHPQSLGQRAESNPEGVPHDNYAEAQESP